MVFGASVYHREKEWSCLSIFWYFLQRSMDNSDIYVIFMFSNFFFGENAQPSCDVKNTIMRWTQLPSTSDSMNKGLFHPSHQGMSFHTQVIFHQAQAAHTQLPFTHLHCSFHHSQFKHGGGFFNTSVHETQPRGWKWLTCLLVPKGPKSTHSWFPKAMPWDLQ